MKLLFICTHNRCRSILCEAVVNTLSKGLIIAKSAGSQPAGRVHPLTLKYLEKCGYPVEGLKSQSWLEFEDFSADAVITVCDAAADESCPTWFDNGLRLHWPLTDPSKLEATEHATEIAFTTCIGDIEQRTKLLIDAAKKSATLDELTDLLTQTGAVK